VHTAVVLHGLAVDFLACTCACDVEIPFGVGAHAIHIGESLAWCAGADAGVFKVAIGLDAVEAVLGIKGGAVGGDFDAVGVLGGDLADIFAFEGYGPKAFGHAGDVETGGVGGDGHIVGGIGPVGLLDFKGVEGGDFAGRDVNLEDGATELIGDVECVVGADDETIAAHAFGEFDEDFGFRLTGAEDADVTVTSGVIIVGAHIDEIKIPGEIGVTAFHIGNTDSGGERGGLGAGGFFRSADGEGEREGESDGESDGERKEEGRNGSEGWKTHKWTVARSLLGVNPRDGIRWLVWVNRSRWSRVGWQVGNWRSAGRRRFRAQSTGGG